MRLKTAQADRHLAGAKEDWTSVAWQYEAKPCGLLIRQQHPYEGRFQSTWEVFMNQEPTLGFYFEFATPKVMESLARTFQVALVGSGLPEDTCWGR